MLTATKAQYQAAIDKAERLGGVRRVRFMGRGDYRVRGEHGRYIVHVGRDGSYACTCPAGQRTLPCWHQAAVWLKLKALQAIRPIAAPAPAAAALPATPAPSAVRITWDEQPASAAELASIYGGSR